MKTTVDDINALLPQTQCGLCEYDGCKPYAQAMVNENESIDRCLPGGTDVLKQLGAALHQDAAPYLDNMLQKQKPALTAIIREEECIGCTKCIQACPVDAIIGAAKHMHTVIQSECTGCELCVEPCPVDCIDIVETGETLDLDTKMQCAKKYKVRFDTRNDRLATQEKTAIQSIKAKSSLAKDSESDRQAKKDYIKAAMERSKKKSQQE